MATALTSASGVIALLDEPEAALKVHALHNLNSIVDTFWSEIAASIGKMYVWSVIHIIIHLLCGEFKVIGRVHIRVVMVLFIFHSFHFFQL